ncbi:hypothetical protein ACS0TY_005095 [Phlomoides rotata]
MASGPSSTDPLLFPPLVDPIPPDSIPKPSYVSVAQKSTHSSSNRFFDEKIVTPVCTIEECGGTPVLVFSSTATESLAKDLKLALVGKFSHALPSGKQVANGIHALNIEGGFSWSFLNSRHILLRLQNEVDFNRLWLQTQFLISGCPMRIFKWTPTFNPMLESSLVPVWCDLPCLPAHLFNHSTLFYIGKMIGKPLQVDSATACCSRLSKARLCVEVDLREPRVHEVMLKIEDVLVEQKVFYDYVPPFCVLCSHVGHHKDDCYVYGNKPHPPRRFDTKNAKNVKGKTPMHGNDGIPATGSSKQSEVSKVHDDTVTRNGKGKGLMHDDKHNDITDEVTVLVPRSESAPRGWDYDGVSGYNPFGPLAMTVYEKDREEGEIVGSDHDIPENGEFEESESDVLSSEGSDVEGSGSDSDYSDGSASEDVDRSEENDLLTMHTLIHADSSSESGQAPASGMIPDSIPDSTATDGLQESSIPMQLNANVSGKLNAAVSKIHSVSKTSSCSKRTTGRRDIELIPIAGLGLIECGPGLAHVTRSKHSDSGKENSDHSIGNEIASVSNLPSINLDANSGLITPLPAVGIEGGVKSAEIDLPTCAMEQPTEGNLIDKGSVSNKLNLDANSGMNASAVAIEGGVNLAEINSLMKPKLKKPPDELNSDKGSLIGAPFADGDQVSISVPFLSPEISALKSVNELDNVDRNLIANPPRILIDSYADLGAQVNQFSEFNSQALALKAQVDDNSIINLDNKEAQHLLLNSHNMIEGPIISSGVSNSNAIIHDLLNDVSNTSIDKSFQPASSFFQKLSDPPDILKNKSNRDESLPSFNTPTMKKFSLVPPSTSNLDKDKFVTRRPVSPNFVQPADLCDTDPS